MRDEIRSIRGIDICVESFGSKQDPCVLLIMGAMASMLWWDEAFCRSLASRGLFVVRFDNRDVGRSTCTAGSAPDYDVDDMVVDALGVLDSFEVRRAHLVGMSLGGMLAQVAALRFPDRVLSITAIASGVFDDRRDLPGIDSAVLEYHGGAAELDWSCETNVTEHLVGGWALLAGSQRPFDNSRATVLATAEFRRARTLPRRFNHAQLGGAEDLYGKTEDISVPVLVIHGTDDRVLPLPHAEALAAGAPDSKLVTLVGAGHEIHRDDWPRIIFEIAEHVHRSTK